MENINTKAHRFLSSYINSNTIAIDATMGNGNDTLFLAERCKLVYALDIQPLALEKTKLKIQNHSNVNLFLLGHEQMDQVILESVDCIMFNFGYLPHSDKSILTKSNTSVKAIKLALSLLKTQGVMTLACYRGHPGGQEEAEAINALLSSLSNCLLIQTETFGFDQDSPILYCIIKKTDIMGI